MDRWRILFSGSFDETNTIGSSVHCLSMVVTRGQEREGPWVDNRDHDLNLTGSATQTNLIFNHHHGYLGLALLRLFTFGMLQTTEKVVV